MRDGDHHEKKNKATAFLFVWNSWQSVWPSSTSSSASWPFLQWTCPLTPRTWPVFTVSEWSTPYIERNLHGLLSTRLRSTFLHSKYYWKIRSSAAFLSLFCLLFLSFSPGAGQQKYKTFSFFFCQRKSPCKFADKGKKQLGNEMLKTSGDTFLSCTRIMTAGPGLQLTYKEILL